MQWQRLHFMIKTDPIIKENKHFSQKKYTKNICVAYNIILDRNMDTIQMKKNQ